MKPTKRHVPMTRRQMLDACVAIAPDFAMKPKTINGQPCIVATCTILGIPMELANVIGGWPRGHIESILLETCLRNLREKRTAAA